MNSYRQLLSLLLLISTSALAQRQYWGIAQGFLGANNPVGASGIIRTDSLGSDAAILYRFGSPGVGYPSPASGLLQASDGLVYCYTSWIDSARVVSIDPVTDSLRIVNAYPIPAFQHTGIRWFSAPVEVQPGQLIDATRGIGIFRYNMASQQLSSVVTMPPDVGGNYGSLGGTLFKANNGKIYGSQEGNSVLGCKLAMIDPVNNTYTRWPVLLDPFNDGYEFNIGPMVQNGANIITLCDQGGPGFDANGFRGYGILGAFNINTATYQPLHYFDSIVHNPRRGFVQGSNGLLYGEAFGDTIVEQGAPQIYYGCIYSYDPATNTVARRYSYGAPGLGWGVTGLAGSFGLLAASNGKLYGSFKNGIFEYDPVADTLVLRAPLMFTDTDGARQGYGLQAPLIEVCRKPNYKPRPTTSFNVCASAYFFYDLKNVNATTVVWRRNGVVVPNQTNQRLEFAAISESDEGTWECILTNECGVTEPPAITITVNPGTFTTSTITGDTLLCGTGDVAVLTGNNGGTWSNGATGGALNVTQPGSYYVYNQQACGLSMSNTVHVVHADSVQAPTIEPNGGSLPFCPSDEILLFNNDPGPWGIDPYGRWQDGSTGTTYMPQDTGLYFVVASNACNSDTSNTIRMVPVPPPAFPIIDLEDGLGNTVDNLLCAGDSVVFTGPPGAQYTIFRNNSYAGFISEPFTFTATTAGTYQVIAYGGCAEFSDTLYIPVFVDTEVPITATILPDQFFLTGCDQDTAYLSSAAPYSFWIWTDAFDVQQTDSTDQLLVDWSIGNNGLYALYNYNGCGNSDPDFIQVIGNPAPDVEYLESMDTLCLTNSPQSLSPGTPAGGTYTGPGVTGNSFNPVLAGVGEHTITYSYNDGNCTGFAQEVVVVDVCSVVEEPLVAGFVELIPNPNDGRFTILANSAFNVGYAILFNALGEEVVPAFRINSNYTVFDQKELRSGTYFLRVTLDEMTFTLPVIVTR